MKSIIVFILGIVGLATALGTGYLLVMDHGLSSTMYQQDAKLQEIPTEQRRAMLDKWVKQVQEGAATAGNPTNRSTGEGVIGTVRSHLPGFDEVEGYFNKTSKRVESAIAALKQDDAAATTKSLDEANVEMDKAVKAYDGAKPEEQSAIRKEATEMVKSLEGSLNELELKEADAIIRKKVENLHSKAKDLANRTE